MSDTATFRHLPDFGRTPLGETAQVFELDNGKGLKLSFSSLGGIVLKLMVPNRHGNAANVNLAPARIEDVFAKGWPYLGSIVGRVAGRIANGRFTLDGKDYQLTTNDGPNTLHGGKYGYDKRIWQIEPLGGASVKLSLVDDSSADGFPGVVNVSVIYTLTDKNAWRIEYEATADAPTPINLTQHIYFNLKDAGRSDVLGHQLRIAASDYTPSDASLMPTGVLAGVTGTPLDFSKLKPIGQDIRKINTTPQGYDDNFVIAAAPGPLREIAEVIEPTSGRRMVVRSTEPAVQLYTSNFLDGTLDSPEGFKYQQHAAVCLETQHYPNAVNVPAFPSTILRPGQTFHSVTEYEFSAE